MIQEKCGRAQSQGAEETGHHEGEGTESEDTSIFTYHLS